MSPHDDVMEAMNRAGCGPLLYLTAIDAPMVGRWGFMGSYWREWTSYVVYPPRKPNLQVVVDNSKESKEH